MDWLQRLEMSGIAASIRQSTWLYPALEIGHILGFTVLVGAAAMFDLRLLGLSRRLPVLDMSRHLLRWSRLSLLLVVPTGFLMFATNATALAANQTFRLKLILMTAAALNAAVFHFLTARSIERWNQETATPFAAKLAALLSLTLWAGVISCGRLLAYL